MCVTAASEMNPEKFNDISPIVPFEKKNEKEIK
jgi:hypothetical protein